MSLLTAQRCVGEGHCYLFGHAALIEFRFCLSSYSDSKVNVMHLIFPLQGQWLIMRSPVKILVGFLYVLHRGDESLRTSVTPPRTFSYSLSISTAAPIHSLPISNDVLKR